MQGESLVFGFLTVRFYEEMKIFLRLVQDRHIDTVTIINLFLVKGLLINKIN